ncbi:TetR/AcrR family transcriptional regulator [Pusillimonas noertemannii]|uniref:TetR family transcriptional regulator n=1 Tax=Pusillimonas noertemannii TaxID=305977 RepID=A0A2U1CPJ8_9BURK|nr:TetR/AcrR family transcriptional regulator [Pusillimonas noertemannii]NYT67143.1 TetR/AcrR family transcriptional regulator [Pusillimonas noertemannii]PVY67818.1 TetR family transcriptional regulator [Pusillimonas noertemannii]TFL12655.1 TetR/AcrR family transcriptional regulator [Pusillimonas noertemannii]
MAQIKKREVRDAILVSAFDLFCRKGYTATTMAEVARQAEVNIGTLYVYFDSKLAILYALYRPWQEEQLRNLAESVRKMRSPAMRLRRLFTGLWADIPAADHSFANTLMEALPASPADAGKQDNLLEDVEVFLTELLKEILPEHRHCLLRGGLLSHLIWMAFDGYTINSRLRDLRDISATADLFSDLLMGVEPQDAAS